MTTYILSTMTNSVSYAIWGSAGDLPVMKSKVTIKGGTGLPSVRSGFGEMATDGEGIPIWTADGVVTPISDEQFLLLKDHPTFKKHLNKNLVKIINKDITGNHKEVQKQVATMEKRDGFAQLNEKTLATQTAAKISKDSIDSDIKFRL